MDTSHPDKRVAKPSQAIQTTTRRIFRYSCGCTTTQIESSRRPPRLLPACEGHGGRLLKKKEIIEYSYSDPDK